MKNGDKLAKIRKYLGKTQEEMARELIMNRAYYSLLEVGKREVSEQTVRKLYTLLKVRQEWWEKGMEPILEPEEERTDMNLVLQMFQELPEKQQEFVATIIATLKREQEQDNSG